MAQTTSVLWSADQGLNEEAKAVGRNNIDAASTSDVRTLSNIVDNLRSQVSNIEITSEDNSVKVTETTDTQSNTKKFDISANSEIIATKKSVDDVKVDLDDLTVIVNNHTSQIGQIQEDVEAVENALANKKDKQTAKTFNGSSTKTIKKITQNVNGELNVEFDDIDLPSQVPNVEISSEDNSVKITESTDEQSNSKTFDLSVDVDDKIPDPSTSNPLMDGTASVGLSSKYAREDHVHPSDTSKEAVLNKTTVVIGTSNTKYPTDKAVADFVNSSVATNTANYISNDGEPFISVEELEAYPGTVTNNDYAFVTGTDSAGNTYYDRYKATVSGSAVTWALEYRLNNSSFTATQWAAINSGITSEKANYWDGKQDALTFDGTYNGSNNKAATVSSITSRINNLVAVNLVQDFTEEEKAQARLNIGAAAISSLNQLSDKVRDLRSQVAANTGELESMKWTKVDVDTIITIPAKELFTVGNLTIGYYFDNAASFRLSMKSTSGTRYIYLSDNMGYGGGYQVTNSSWSIITMRGFSNSCQYESLIGYDCTSDTPIHFEVQFAASSNSSFGTICLHRVLEG